jgi:hypothetical protein
METVMETIDASKFEPLDEMPIDASSRPSFDPIHPSELKVNYLNRTMMRF